MPYFSYTFVSSTSGSPAIDVKREMTAATKETERTFTQFTSMTACPTVSMEIAVWQNVFAHLTRAHFSHILKLFLIINPFCVPALRFLRRGSQRWWKVRRSVPRAFQCACHGFHNPCAFLPMWRSDRRDFLHIRKTRSYRCSQWRICMV